MKSSNDFTFDIKSGLDWIIGNSLQEKFLALKSLNFDMGLCIDDELIKADRPIHLYIRKYQKGNRWVYVYDDAGKEKHRYDDDGKLDSLMEMGSHLDNIDDVREQNFAGFNRIDKQRWQNLIHSVSSLSHDQKIKFIPQLKSILKKYKRQLSEKFGAEEYEHTGMADATMHVVDPARHPRWKTIQLPLKSDGRLGRDQFNKYLSIQRESGLRGGRDESGQFIWFIPRENEAAFDWSKYESKLAEIGISLGDIPEPEPEAAQPSEPLGAPVPVSSSSSPAPRPTPAPETVDQVIEAIKNRRANKVLAIKRDADGKFSLFHPYDPEVVNFFSNRGGEISGIMEYNPNQKSRETHELELVQEVMEKFKDKFPEWRIVTGGVDEAIREEERRQAELRLPIPHVAEKMNPEFKLFPYQNEAVRFLENANGNALIGDEMGLGKTLQSLAYVAGNNKRVLVVVPKVVRRTWVQEAEKFFPDYFKGKSKELIPAELAKNGMPDLTGVNIATVNYESLEKFMPAIQAAGFDTIVVDESHRIKSPTAKITKTITRMAPLFAHKILLSGTAVKNKKEELFTQMQIIRPNLFSKDELKRGTIGGVWNKLKRTGAYISRQKRKVLADLPEKTTQIAEVPVAGMPTFPRDIGEMSAAKVKAALAKVPATHDFVNEILESSDSSVLLFTESVEAAQKLKELFGDVAILHHGQMSDEKREQAKAEFQNPDSPKRVFISTRQSLAVGATLTRADKVVFNDLPWTAADVRQAEDRAHRVGQRNNVNVYWITAQNNDWDTNLAAIVKKKYELNRKLNEGKQLSREEREWMEKPVSLEDIRAEMTGRSPIEDTAKSFSQTTSEKAVEMFFIKSDKIRGGKADDKKPSDFDKKKLAEGAKVEREHTSDKKMAQEIAMDHLTEDPNYYVKLKEVEKGKEPPTLGEKEGRVPVMRKPAPSAPPSTLSMHKGDKPFHGYNKKRHSPTGGLNAKFRAKYNREHGSNLQAPVTEKKPTGKRAARRRSFCARMSGVKGPTSKNGKLTPKGAALKRWRCSETYVVDLVKAMLGQSVAGHKYIRKFMRNGKWVYIYHESNQKGRAIPEEVVNHLKRLADAGDEKARQLHESIQPHDEEKLKVLRRLADLGDQQAHDQLRRFGIDREKERIEEALIRQQPKDPIDEEKSAEWQRDAIGQVIAEIQDARDHLTRHRDTPIAAAIWDTLSDEHLTDELKQSKTIRQLMDNLEKIARKLEEKQGSVTAQRPSNHVTYGNMIYNKSLARLTSRELLPREYAELHTRQARSTDHKTSTMAGIQDRIRERQEREQRERAEREKRERRERAEREERERRELESIHGSMAHHMSNLLSRPLNPAQIVSLNRTLNTIFGKEFRAEDWPYQFPEGTTMKITHLEYGSSSVQMEMQIYNAQGEPMMEGWTRSWSVDNGRPKIYNSYMKVRSSARNTIQVGEYINSGQRRLLRSCPNGGKIGVSASLDVGAYNWANQGFSFSSNSELDYYRRDFQSYARSKGVILSDEDMQKFKAPVHFAAFRNGKKYLRETSVTSNLSEQQIQTRSLSGVEGEFPLSQEEIRTRKTKRMLCHLGKDFMLGRGWRGIWDSNRDTPESRYAEAYRQMRERAIKHLQQEYRELLERVELQTPPSPRQPNTVDSDPNQINPPEMASPRISLRSPQNSLDDLRSRENLEHWAINSDLLTQARFTNSDASKIRLRDINPQVGVYRRVADERGDPRYHRIYSEISGRFVLESRTDNTTRNNSSLHSSVFSSLPDAIIMSDNWARRASGRENYRTTVAARPTTNEYGAVSSHVENTLRSWAGGINQDGQYVRTIRMTAARMNRLRFWPLANLKYFREYAPLTLAARRQVTEMMREIENARRVG